ncbi:MAG: bifunctional DNA primase/polymerase [Dehalococcoidia bacterium]
MADGSYLRDAAIDYAGRGWAVFPLHNVTDGKCTCGQEDCPHPGKHPRTAHGRNDATLNKAAIIQWWKKWPNANIGIATGKESGGLLVLDIDKKHGGLENLKKLTQKGNLPTTISVYSGGGGEHYYLSGNGTEIRNVPIVDGLTGIEVRGYGGSIVAPPSNHVSGEKYAWRINPDAGIVAPMPDWLLRVITKKKEKIYSPGGDQSYWEQLWGGVEEHEGRNNRATQLAGRLLGRGLQFEEVLTILRLWNDTNIPPLSEAELTASVKSINRSEQSKPDKGAIMGADWLLSQPIEEVPNIVSKGLLVLNGNMMITGESEAGKSMLSLQLAIHLAKGISFFGFEIKEPQRVLIIQKENPTASVQQRLQRMCQGMGISSIKNLFVVENNFKANLNQPRDIARIKERIENVRAQVVILDPLSSYHMLNENDNIMMRQTLDKLTDLSREVNCTWIVIHHEGKPGEKGDKLSRWRFRGASSIRDWCDTMIGLLIRENKEDRIMRTLSFDKIRHGARQRALILERNKRHWTYELTEENVKVPFSLIADCLQDMGGLSMGKAPLAKNIMKRANCSMRTVYNAIDQAMDKILIESSGYIYLIGES